jgi:hypothetical protein
MMLTQIEPGRNGPDLRTFECSKCEHVYKVLAEDPTKSAERQPQFANVVAS